MYAGVYSVRLSFLLMPDNDDDAIHHEKNHAVTTIWPLPLMMLGMQQGMAS